MIKQILDAVLPPPVPQQARPDEGRITYGLFGGRAGTARSGQPVSVETSKTIATAYRCASILSDDVGIMPQQLFRQFNKKVSRVYPDAVTRNMAYLMEVAPNRWMTPFVFKRTVMHWLIFYGNAYIWRPVGPRPELFVLRADRTYPTLDENGNKWYATKFPNQSEELIPDAEVLHLMMNSPDGMAGRSVLEYARETLGRQLAAHKTQDEIAGNSLLPTAVLYADSSELSKESREVVKSSFLDAARGGVAVLDRRVSKFETITMKPADAQFLEGISATDTEIANFFGVPEYRLNRGKQSYESNAQQDLNYLKTTLNAYLVQWEQGARLKWIDEADQPFQYVRFNRDSILQTDAKTRTEILRLRVQSGMLSPNEARAIEDMNGYPGGDSYYMQTSYGRVLADGRVETAAGPAAEGEDSEDTDESA